MEFLHSLTEWAHSNRGERQSVLLFIDDLSVMMNIEERARQDLRWLLLRGPARRVWPIVTINPKTGAGCASLDFVLSHPIIWQNRRPAGSE